MTIRAKNTNPSFIPFDQREGWIWLDGDIVPWKEARTHVLNHGLHYASCVFEGERVYQSVVFELERHSQRLSDSAKALGFSLPFTVDHINQATRSIIARQNISEGYVRPFAWRGSEMMAISAQDSTIHLAIATWPWPTYFDPQARRRGIRLATSSWRRPAPDTAPTGSKSAGLYMICTLSKHQAEAQGYDDALMLDYRGQVAEATGANIFFVIRGQLHTPQADCFLDGITRQTIIHLARKEGIEVYERAIMPDEIEQADEAFLTGTAVEITPIGVIDDHHFRVGEITKKLSAAYLHHVDAYCRRIKKESPTPHSANLGVSKGL